MNYLTTRMTDKYARELAVAALTGALEDDQAMIFTKHKELWRNHPDTIEAITQVAMKYVGSDEFFRQHFPMIQSDMVAYRATQVARGALSLC